MYNLHTHERQQKKLTDYIKMTKSLNHLQSIRKKSNEKMGQKYKERVRDFLVKITSKPIVLGMYQPPVMNIVRNPEVEKIRANAQLYINGFKTNKERNVVQENRILDLNPTRSTALLHNFRPRDIKSQIQPGMRFAGRSTSETKLPKIDLKRNPSLKLRFKGVQQMGNNLKSMKSTMADEIGLVNRLQTVSGGKEFDHLAFSMMALRDAKLITGKRKGDLCATQ